MSKILGADGTEFVAEPEQAAPVTEQATPTPVPQTPFMQALVAPRSDDTWKAKAQQEKEKLAQEQQPQHNEPPPFDFRTLCEVFMARFSYGMGGNIDAKGNAVINLEIGRQSIEAMAFLAEKTEGNLTDEETVFLQQATSAMTQLFVSTITELRNRGLI